MDSNYRGVAWVPPVEIERLGRHRRRWFARRVPPATHGDHASSFRDITYGDFFKADGE